MKKDELIEKRNKLSELNVKKSEVGNDISQDEKSKRARELRELYEMSQEEKLRNIYKLEYVPNENLVNL